jgi:single-strand DNA-binding protein
MPSPVEHRRDAASSAAPGAASPPAVSKGADPQQHRNEVLVVGRLAADADERALPSGDVIAVWRLVVERDAPPIAGRPHLDTLECVAWLPRVRRSAQTWQPGDTIEVTGALRRRFWRAGPAVNSRYEIETRQARRIARAVAS